MKKIFMKISAPATLAIAVALGACNTEDAQKQLEEQNATIQALVDEQLVALEEEVNLECTTLVDSLANVQYEAFLEAAKKAGKKVAAKATPAPAPKKEEPKKTETKADKMGGTTAPGNTAEEKSSKMGGTGAAGNDAKSKASKMGGQQ